MLVGRERKAQETRQVLIQEFTQEGNVWETIQENGEEWKEDESLSNTVRFFLLEHCFYYTRKMAERKQIIEMTMQVLISTTHAKAKLSAICIQNITVLLL